MLEQLMKTIYLSLLFTTIFVAACNPPETALTVTSQVRGEITFEGEPLANAKVVFVPQKLMSETRKAIPLAYGITDESGSYVLKLSDGSVNIVKGEYRVIISKRNDPGEENVRLPDLVNQFENLVPSEFAMFRDKIVREEILPTRYNERTILNFKVEPESEIGVANFDLTN
jgi:hypothetical protein